MKYVGRANKAQYPMTVKVSEISNTVELAESVGSAGSFVLHALRTAVDGVCNLTYAEAETLRTFSEHCERFKHSKSS